MEQTLPEELWLRIFTCLDPVDLSRAAQVCSHWSQLISQSETLWKSQCMSVTDLQIKQQILADKSRAQSRWKDHENYIQDREDFYPEDVYLDNYGHRFTKRQWLEGKISFITCLDELPAKAFYPMDVHTWGEIFEHELKR